jgi:predicted transcriptional regulator
MLTPEMLMLRRMRAVLNLRQIDVWAGCGVTPGRLSKAENGKLRLNQTEMTALRVFLTKQWEMCQQSEQHHGKSRQVMMVSA